MMERKSNMLITIKNVTKNEIAWRQLAARRIILEYKLNTDDKLIEQQVYNKYQITLKQAALDILQHCRFSYKEQNCTITILNKKYDKMARLITFGSGKCHGSDILITALK